MKRSMVAVLFLLPMAPLAGQLSLPRSFPAAAEVSLRILVPAGSVRLETWDRDSIRVTGSVAPKARFFGGGSLTSAKLGVDNNRPNDTTLARGALVVTVPRQAHVWIKMTEGEVASTGTEGELEIITVAGSITVRNAKGAVAVETIDAAVSLDEVEGAARVRTGGGGVTLSNLRASLTVSSVNGKVVLGGDSLQDARIETIGGAITVQGALASTAMVDLDTHFGPVTLLIDPSAAPILSLNARAGEIHNPIKTGSAKAGHLIVRSFRGPIDVVPVVGSERDRGGNPP